MSTESSSFDASAGGRVFEGWASKVGKILFSEEAIAAKVKELGAQISRDYAGEKVLVVGLLSGAFVFAADLLRHVSAQYDLDFVSLSSYGRGTVTSGSVKLNKDLSIDPRGRHVLVVEDLIDTGVTLEWFSNHLASKGCLSVKICCLLDKKARRTANVPIAYCGFECPDEFVVGYGMDFADEYRCLPYVGVLKPSAYGGVDPHEAAHA